MIQKQPIRHRNPNYPSQVKVYFWHYEWCSLLGSMNNNVMRDENGRWWMYIHKHHPFSSITIHFRSFSSIYIHYHPPSSITIHLHRSPSILIHHHLFSSLPLHHRHHSSIFIFIHFHPFTSIFIHIHPPPSIFIPHNIVVHTLQQRTPFIMSKIYLYKFGFLWRIDLGSSDG